jgi:hypothetical protein
MQSYKTSEAKTMLTELKQHALAAGANAQNSTIR